MSEHEKKEMKYRILYGISLAFERLVEQKQKEDAELAFSQDGKIVRVRARDLRPGVR